MILLTAMEYMREETDEKKEASSQTSSSTKDDTKDFAELEVTTKVAAWQEQQKEGNCKNWFNRIKTFGKKKC